MPKDDVGSPIEENYVSVSFGHISNIAQITCQQKNIAFMYSYQILMRYDKENRQVSIDTTSNQARIQLKVSVFVILDMLIQRFEILQFFVPGGGIWVNSDSFQDRGQFV